MKLSVAQGGPKPHHSGGGGQGRGGFSGGGGQGRGGRGQGSGGYHNNGTRGQGSHGRGDARGHDVRHNQSTGGGGGGGTSSQRGNGGANAEIESAEEKEEMIQDTTPAQVTQAAVGPKSADLSVDIVPPTETTEPTEVPSSTSVNGHQTPKMTFAVSLIIINGDKCAGLRPQAGQSFHPFSCKVRATSEEEWCDMSLNLKKDAHRTIDETFGLKLEPVANWRETYDAPFCLRILSASVINEVSSIQGKFKVKWVD